MDRTVFLEVTIRMMVPPFTQTYVLSVENLDWMDNYSKGV
jgi:hypothetical protein